MAIQFQKSDGTPSARTPSLHSVARARRAQRHWSQVGVGQRLEVIQNFRWALAKQGSALARTVELDRSGGLAETLSAEILPLADACRFLEDEATTLLRPRRLSSRGRPLWLFGTSSEVHRQPLGVVLIIAASNYPLLLPGVQTIQALVAGNAVLLKPGRNCSKAAQALVNLLVECGLPKDLVAILDESPVAAQWAMDAGVDKVLLTGSLTTGREVLARLVPNVTPAIVELSGCDAVFVLPNADLNLVARALAFGLRLNGGATCIAPRRVFVPKSRLYALQHQLESALIDSPTVEVDSAIASLVTDLIAEAQAEGATVACGDVPSENRMRPLVVSNATPDMRLLRTDVFAPVLSLVGVNDAEEALALDAQCPYALGATVFGSAPEARRFAQRVEAGVIVVNDMIAPTADPRLPFGGRGSSGFGSTRGAEGLLELTAPRVVIQRHAKTHPHFETLQPGDERLFESYLKATHSRRWSDRFDGWRNLIRDLRSKSRGKMEEK